MNKNFISSTHFQNVTYQVKEECVRERDLKIIYKKAELFEELNLFDNMTISFHHHLRNGDFMINEILNEFLVQSVAVNLACSSIFPSYKNIVAMMEKGLVNNIHANYINGEVSDAIHKHLLNGFLYMHTHGGRSRAIKCGDIDIDVAFIVASECDKYGNANGLFGNSAFGSLGYGVDDAMYASKTVIITDNLVDEISFKQIEGKYVDYIYVVNKIGDNNGIVSGTTKLSTNPVSTIIAENTIAFLKEAELIKNGFSFQTGAGGISLTVTKLLHEVLHKKHIVGSFASGGITGYHTKLLEEGLLQKIYDVQCFDLEAVQSMRKNAKHEFMSAAKYASILEDNIADQLNFVVLGATEIDLDFNVNVTTDSNGKIIGGSGGHSDTAYGADVTIITSPLFKARTPLIKSRVTTITTPGEDVDVLVTERGIAINPKRKDLLEKLANSNLTIYTIKELQEMAFNYCGIPEELPSEKIVVGYVIYRDGTVIDELYAINTEE